MTLAKEYQKSLRCADGIETQRHPRYRPDDAINQHFPALLERANSCIGTLAKHTVDLTNIVALLG